MALDEYFAPKPLELLVRGYYDGEGSTPESAQKWWKVINHIISADGVDVSAMTNLSARNFNAEAFTADMIRVYAQYATHPHKNDAIREKRLGAIRTITETTIPKDKVAEVLAHTHLAVDSLRQSPSVKELADTIAMGIPSIIPMPKGELAARALIRESQKVLREISSDKTRRRVVGVAAAGAVGLTVVGNVTPAAAQDTGSGDTIVVLDRTNTPKPNATQPSPSASTPNTPQKPGFKTATPANLDEVISALTGGSNNNQARSTPAAKDTIPAAQSVSSPNSAATPNQSPATQTTQQPESSSTATAIPSHEDGFVAGITDLFRSDEGRSDTGGPSGAAERANYTRTPTSGIEAPAVSEEVAPSIGEALGSIGSSIATQSPSTESPNSPSQTPETTKNDSELDAQSKAIISGLDISESKKKTLEQFILGARSAKNNGAKINADVMIAQAILETGWGGSELASKYYNFFGIKAGSNWDGKKIMMPTKEYENGEWVTKDQPFRAYDSIAESFADYGKYIEGSRYFSDAVKYAEDDEGYLKVLVGGKVKYATDPEYHDKIMHVIKNNKIDTIMKIEVGQQKGQQNEDSVDTSEFTAKLKEQISNLKRTNAEKNDVTALISKAIDFSRNYSVARNNPVSADSDFLQALKRNGYSTGSGFRAPRYDCMKFVTVTARESGIDPKFNSMGASTKGLFRYVKKNTVDGITNLGGTANYRVIANPEKSELQPGDIVLGKGHVFIWTGPIKGKDGKVYRMIEAALGSSRVPSMRDGVDDWNWMVDYMKGRGGIVALRVVHPDSDLN